MELQSAPTIELAGLSREVAESPLKSMAESAHIEFQVALQLLAERASFLTAATGVAIALPEAGLSIYCAAIGSSVSACGTPVEMSEPAIQECVQHRRIVRLVTGDKFKVLAPIAVDEKAIGFFEVISKYEWTDQDVAAITRLADVASVAVEHRRAAEIADAQAWQGLQQQPLPTMWHAPEKPGLAVASHPETGPRNIADVKTCGACGFPVSPGRNLCVECEQKSDALMPPAPELFSTQNQESWISEHGYTVASLIVSLVAVALIFWLRR
jgi:hypothetical protein